MQTSLIAINITRLAFGIVFYSDIIIYDFTKAGTFNVNQPFEKLKKGTLVKKSVTAKLISAFVFATRIVQSLFFLNPKFQASSHLLWLCSPVSVGPGRKPRRPVFSQRGSFNMQITTIRPLTSCNDVLINVALNYGGKIAFNCKLAIK